MASRTGVLFTQLTYLGRKHKLQERDRTQASTKSYRTITSAQETYIATMASDHGLGQAFEMENEVADDFGSASDNDEASIVDLDETRRKSSLHRVNAQRVERVAEAGAARMHQTIETSRDWIKARFPPRSQEQFNALLPSPDFSEDWTEADEALIQAKVESSSQWRDLQDVKDSTMGVWKFCFRFTGRLVTDVIGLNTGLVYEGSIRWPDTFIRRLHVYLCLPFMRGDVMKLRLALQWAVICRDDDRRCHYLNGCATDIFLRILAELVDRQDGTVEPAVLRRVALRIYMAKYAGDGVVEPEWSVLMDNIEVRLSPAVLRRKTKAPVEDVSAPHIYKVSTTLLGTVIQAVEDLTVFSVRSNVHAETVRDVTSLARAVTDRPLKDDVLQAIKAVLSAEERQNRLQGRAVGDSPRVPL